MRCLCCNKELKDHEALARNSYTKEFEDTCRVCINAAAYTPDAADRDYLDVPLIEGLSSGPKTFS